MLRHFHPHRIALHPDDERSAHQFRARRRAKADRSLREDHDRVADANVRGFRAAESGRSDVGEQHHLFVAQLVRNFREVRLRVRNEQIFRLRAVDRVAEAPAADRFDTFAMSALRPLCREAGPALSAGRDRADEHAIADLVAGHTFTQFLDHADRLVSDHESRLYRIFAAQNMEVGPANRRERDANDRFAGPARGRGTSSSGYRSAREKRWPSFFALSISLVRPRPVLLSFRRIFESRPQVVWSKPVLKNRQ